MLLGGIRYLLPVIEAAHKQGYYVITADYLPGNVAHKHSDEYVNVSIIEKEDVLKVAQEKKIDGIMSFGVDPGVVTAAYVADRMGLPSSGPYRSVEILQNKDLFRKFLENNSFNVPWNQSFSSVEEAMRQEFPYPIIVKPTDSAGSKGVSRVNQAEDLKPALENAFAFAAKGKIIVEEFIEKKCCSSDTDCFSVDGIFKFMSFSAQRFDEKAANPYTPAAYTWPSAFTKQQEAYLSGELQRLITLLGMGTSIYNIETRIGADGKPYIMEVSPRGGGNRLAEVLRLATGVDMISACVKAAVGEPFETISQERYNGIWAEIILHADKVGIFRGLDISPELRRSIVDYDLWVEEGATVNGFKGANDALGTLILKFGSLPEAEALISNQRALISVLVS